MLHDRRDVILEGRKSGEKENVAYLDGGGIGEKKACGMWKKW